MRIGFVGNTNNYPFRLARALRMLGHEVIFMVDRPSNEPRHRPESHYKDVSYPYPDWIREITPLGPLQLVLYPWILRPILRTLDACDGVILNGLALSLGTSINRPTIGLLTGSDLDVFSNTKLVDVLAAALHPPGRLQKIRPLEKIAIAIKRKLLARLVQLQRAGIARCRLVEYAIPGLLPHSDKLLDEIGVVKQRRASFMLTDIESLPSAQESEDRMIRIFCATRLQWKQPVSGATISRLDNKGTDVMLEGLSMFVANSRHLVKIHLIAFGADAKAAEGYVQEMGLGHHVSWHPQLSQEEFLAELAKADVVLENFGLEGCVGMAGRDAIAMGKPVVAWGKSAVFQRVLGEPLPIYEASTATEICAQLNRIINDPTEVARHSSRAREFASRWFSARKAAEHCVTIFEEAQQGYLKR